MRVQGQLLTKSREFYLYPLTPVTELLRMNESGSRQCVAQEPERWQENPGCQKGYFSASMTASARARLALSIPVASYLVKRLMAPRRMVRGSPSSM